MAFMGINNRLDPDKLPPGMLWDAQNCRMRKGTADTRLGVVKPGWLNDTTAGGTMTGPVGQFYGAGLFTDPNSFEWILQAVNGAIYRHKEHNTRVQLALPTGVKILSRCQFVQAFDQVFCFRGQQLAPLAMTDVDDGFLDILPQWNASTVYDAAIVATGQTADEVAYGPFQAVSTLTSSAGLATVVTTDAHGYITGADVTITGASPSAYNGRFNITVIDEMTFQYTLPQNESSPATGTIKVSNMANYWQALGSVVTLSTLTSASTTATATATAHGFTTGQYVTIAGASPAAYDGTYEITVTGANTFTYIFAGSGTSPATGTITAQTSVVLAGQSPDTNAAAWQQIYNVLPNANDALYINDQLLVPTAYTPTAAGYGAGSAYTKTDYIVAMNYLDPVHFNFVNEFRINQGDDDEIKCLVKYAANVAVCFKGKSFAVISNIALDLSQLTVDMHIGYGATGVRAAVAAGKNVIFASAKRGFCSILNNQLGQIRSVDIPFSNDIPNWIEKINWSLGDQIRVEWWDDKLYAAVPLSAGTTAIGKDIVATNYSIVNSVPLRELIQVSGFEPGQLYQWTKGNAIALASNFSYANNVIQLSGLVLTKSAPFVAQQTVYYILMLPNWSQLTTTIQPVFSEVNNGILVYDFRQGITGSTFTADFKAGEWCGCDNGQAICPLEFVKPTSNGLQRLCFAGADGYMSLVEEAAEGDQLGTPGSATGLSFSGIADSRTTRGYVFGSQGLKRFNAMDAVMATWSPNFSVSSNTGSANSTQTVVTSQTFSPLTYIRPFTAAPFDGINDNGDFNTPGRGDYSIAIGADGFYLDGCAVDTQQEFRVREDVRSQRGRYIQFLITNTSGNLSLKSVTPTAAEGQRRAGIIL